MKNTMIRMCVAMWALGLVGMSVAHGAFGQGPEDLVCGLFARLWAVGGTSFLILGALHVFAQGGAAANMSAED